MMLLAHLLAVCVIIINVCQVNAQSAVPECPSPWVSEGNKCYLFSKDYSLPWEDAEIYCVKQGAELISVNADIEHDFVQNYFLEFEVNPDDRDQWYTSGRAIPGSPRENPDFLWADKTGFGSNVYWVNPEAAKTDTGDYVVYKYADTGVHESQPGYYWVRDNGLLPRPFICEINKVDADVITSKPRDFIFGADNVHPDMIFRGPYFVSQPKDLSFQLSPDDEEGSLSDATASFDCEARGYPQPEYNWYQETGNGTFPITSVGSNVGHLTISSGRLTIHGPSRERDIASYWCEAYNEFGKIRSEQARINFITLEEFPKTSKNITAYAYDSAVIVCDNANKREGVRYNYKWFKNNDPRNFVTSIYFKHIFVSASGSLYFSSVTTQDSAAYHCTVSIAGGVESRSSPANNLIINTSPSYQDVGPIIHNDFIKIIPKNPQRGDMVYLECLARFTRRSGEIPQYTWLRANDREMPEDHELVDYGRRLIIHDVKAEDEGEYTCTASAQQSSDFKSITLSISAKPYFGEGRLDDQHLDNGDNFRWICLANGNPDPTYEWYRNGAIFNVNTLPPGMSGRVTFSVDVRTLEFSPLDSAVDPGMYQCAASNAHGTTYSSAQMRVLEFGPSFAKHPMLGKVLATEAGNATIACDPEAAPKATIKWLKDGNPYQVSIDSASPKRLLPNNYLFLSGIEKSVDEGIYTCVAENTVPDEEAGKEFSVVEAQIQLLVVQRSRLAFGPVDVRVRLFSMVVLECRADFNPRLDLVYLWYHNDRHFDDWKMAQIYSRGEGVNRGDLHIMNITYEERGTFKCTVMTKSDFATLSAQVTVFGPPGEPAGIVASNAGKHSVVISWSRGAENGAPVTSYIIEKYNEDTKIWVIAKNVTNAADVASGNTTVGDLFANTGYLFRIEAVNMHGIGVPSVESASVVKTSPDKPTTYPADLRAGGGKEGTLVIEWTPLPREQWNAPDIVYIVQYRLYEPDQTADQGTWMGCNDGDPIRHGTKKSGKCVVTLGRELFYLKYSIRVWARNEVGEGPIPDPVQGMSAVRVPTQTPQQIVVQPFNATGLSVYWDPLSDSREVTGGELLGFHIQYWKDGTKQSLGRRNTILGNVTGGLIIGLEPNTDYLATAQPFNSAGDAPPGRSIPQTTFYNAPLNMPEYVTLNRTDGQYVGVHFRGVVTGPDEEPLDGYKVRIWRQGESLRNAKDYDCGRRTWIMIEENFEKNAFYNLRVFGYSRGGVGKMSSPLIQFTIAMLSRKWKASLSVLPMLHKLKADVKNLMLIQAQMLSKVKEEVMRSCISSLKNHQLLHQQDMMISLTIHKYGRTFVEMTISTVASFNITNKNGATLRGEQKSLLPILRWPTVSAVVYGGNAYTAGLCVGDILLTVNGKDLSNATHEETVNSLNAAQEPIIVEVLRRSTHSQIANLQNSNIEQSSTISVATVATQTEASTMVSDTTCPNKMFIVPAPPPLNSSCEEVLALSESNSESTLDDQSYDVEYDEITLRRASCNDRIGLTLCYGETEQDGVSNIYIGEVEHNSVAGRNGRIQEGDQIIKINNQYVRNRAEAIKLFSESKADIHLLICRPANLDQMDDGFLEECSSNSEEDHIYECVYAQDLRQMPLIVEERSEYEDESTLTDTATLPSQKEKEGKDSGVGQDSAGSSEQEFESSHYETLLPCEDLDLPSPSTMSEENLRFRQLLESKCAELSLDSVDQLCDRLNQLQQTDNNNRVVPKMGTKIMHQQNGAELTSTPTHCEANDTAYNTAESTPTTLELTKNLTGSSFSLSPSKKQSRRSHEKRRRQSESLSKSPASSHSDITYTTEEKLEETMAHQQQILLQQSKNSTLTRENHEVSEDAGAITGNSHMEWVVKRRSDGTRYVTRRPIRTKILKERKKKLENERCGMTTDDDTMSELKVGRHWTREERRAHMQNAREHQQRKAIMQRRIEMARKAAREGHNNLIEMSNKKLHKHAMKDLDFTTVQELLTHQGKISFSPSNLVSVTTV